ncbi:MAG: [FeFe] hydrogenase H-cluster radical SAM maturase HydE [Spirochaetae bacterium HGW-Spirochaetae-5]|nr:MAG: [FeFe] hydrogenase H-cluster radical SAM maturase HydE [Spirochaetae bacterium HGW-Spirochaetae-5]
MTSISRPEIVELLKLRGKEQREFHKRASAIRKDNITDKVYLRGLIEFSNICANDCLYCGIRKSNINIRRYGLSPDEILASADEAAEAGLTSILLQSGERRDRDFTSHLSYSLKLIKHKHPRMNITLSVGEQERGIYEEFYEQGATRYLLRIETSSESHYRKLHPEPMSFSRRVQCLNDLRDIGFQVGTGVMVNSPYQTLANLADDILFFTTLDIDMCGMGPYIPHSDTPLSGIEYLSEESLNLGLNMIAVLRTVMPDINIASTTALETLSPGGRELGLLAGANVIMPQFSPFASRTDYALYDNKPQGVRECRDFVNSVKERIEELGLVPATEDPGISMHFLRRVKDDSSR